MLLNMLVPFLYLRLNKMTFEEDAEKTGIPPYEQRVLPEDKARDSIRAALDAGNITAALAMYKTAPYTIACDIKLAERLLNVAPSNTRPVLRRILHTVENIESENTSVSYDAPNYDYSKGRLDELYQELDRIRSSL